MGQCGAGLVCLGLLLLVFDQVPAASMGLLRVSTLRRRSEETGGSSDLRRYPGVASGKVEDPGRDLRALAPASSPLGYNRRFGRGFVRYRAGGLQSRQLQPPTNFPISVQCGEDRILVAVKKDLYGNETLVKASDLILGPPSCGAEPQSTDTTVVFEVGLQDCENSIQMTPDWLIYGTNLTFNPTSGAQNLPVTRTSPIVVPIQCYYPRYGNVSSKAIKPTWVPYATTVSSEERLAFSLHLMTEDWSAPRASLVFMLGDFLHIEASLETQNHIPMILLVDSCVATISPDVDSSPGYEIIAYNGCLIDGTQEDSSSAFRSPRPQPYKLQFIVDAFRFLESHLSTIFITCSLRAVADTQVPDPMNKACSYSKASNSWLAVEGSSDICQCCNTQDCAAPAGQSRARGPSYRRPREVLPGPRSEDRRALVSVGPLLVLGEDQRRSLAGRGSGCTVEMWLLVGVGGLSLVVIIILVAVIVQSLRNKPSPLNVQT